MKNSAAGGKSQGPKSFTPDVSKNPQQQRKRWIQFGILGAVTALVVTVLCLWWFSDNRPNAFGQAAVNLLLTNKSIQEDLKVSPEQLGQVGKLEEDRKHYLASPEILALSPYHQRMKAGQYSRVMERGLARVLDKDQMTRLHQIYLQLWTKREGDLVMVLCDDEIASTLGLTKQQKEDIQSVQKEFGAQFWNRMQGGAGAPGGNPDQRQVQPPQLTPEEWRQQAEEARQAHREKILGVLSADQRNTWQGMLGAPFTGEINNAQGGG